MTDVLLTIKQMCEQFNVTARTLRFYEDKELISPIRDGQKRLYRKTDRARLKVILRAKYFGFSLEQARLLLDGRTPGHEAALRPDQLLEIMQKQLSKLRIEHVELTEKIAELENELEIGQQSVQMPTLNSRAA